MADLSDILPAPIRAPHQLKARDLLQTSFRWPDPDREFLRAIICRRRLNLRETSRLAELGRKLQECGT